MRIIKKGSVGYKERKDVNCKESPVYSNRSTVDAPGDINPSGLIISPLCLFLMATLRKFIVDVGRKPPSDRPDNRGIARSLGAGLPAAMPVRIGRTAEACLMNGLGTSSSVKLHLAGVAFSL